MRKLLRNWSEKTGQYERLLRLYFKWSLFIKRLETRVLIPVLSASGLMRKVYFALFSDVFSSEMKLYILGRQAYLKRSLFQQGNPSHLRRNIHRLEKGLMAENRKAFFGADYLLETVHQFAYSVEELQQCTLNDWAFDVLEQYFQCSPEVPLVTQAQGIFSAVNYLKLLPAVYRGPFVKSPTDQELYARFQQLAQSRKSVRSFVPGSVPSADVLKRAVALAALAPSSCNRQPFRFVVLTEAPLVGDVARLAGGARSFAEGIPALAVVLGSTAVSPSPGDRHLMYIDGSLAAMSFMLALESQGCGSCPINWPDHQKADRALRKHLTMKEYERPVMLIAMGMAKDNSMVACSVRKEVEELLEIL
ncbi:nitroreductase family protein [Geofilum rubicundum]|uniref:Nitroreductase family protein n=1 Tax=Geofilum rubicundum JCM 15548 TaxID=1236989 RepID=A0A0E9LXX7_9BACT|nr:nitroreductase family protein [Geofilum rubicundum]GAO29730.1 nitroreductase family protein [Geofilum rubicundum JCM 15548]